MKKNVGGVDRIMRIVLAALIAVLYFMDVLYGTAGIIFLVLGAILLVTALLGRCPLYIPCGINTCLKEGEDKK